MTQQSGHALIRHQEVGNSFDGVYYVESVFVKQTVQKKDYSDFMLRDKSGARNVKFWGVIQDVAKGDYVYISAIVEDYKGSSSIIAKNMEKAETPQDMSDYIPVYDGLENASEKFDALMGQLSEWGKDASGPFVAGMIVNEVFSDAFREKFVSAPGSSKPHYGRQGGLLANVVRVADAALKMADAYALTVQEKGVLLAAALVFRAGSIDAFEFKDCMPVLTKKGILLGINNLTMTRLSSALRRVLSILSKDNRVVDQETIVRIFHAASSYDSRTVLPMTKEAMVLSAAYRSDAEMVDAMDFISDDANVAEEFTAYDPSKGRRYYTGLRVV